jgi:hypothetical protein
LGGGSLLEVQASRKRADMKKYANVKIDGRAEINRTLSQG